MTLVLAHYRVPFHELVRERLAAEGIDYRLIYGAPWGGAAKNWDTAELPWAEKVPCRKLHLFGHDAFWQPVTSLVRGADLTIITQENKLLVNYWLQLSYLFGGRRVAFFGHGKNFQSDAPDGFKERFKSFWATKVHWWFTYTPGCAHIVENAGFPASRITVFNNSIDTRALMREAQGITEKEIEERSKQLGIHSTNLGIYIGGMYREKRLRFLIEAAQLVRQNLPDFHLLLVGSGSDAHIAQDAAKAHDFIHYLGPQFARDKAVLLAMSRVFLIPGLVGLAILDSFASGTPMVTTAVSYHSPEIEYLRNGENGIIVTEPNSCEHYASAVSRLITEEHTRLAMKQSALRSAQMYSIEDMADRFCAGIMRALSA